MGIVLKTKGSFTKTERFLVKLSKFNNSRVLTKLDRYGIKGIEALASNTPYDTGKTAESWKYDIVKEDDKIKLIFTNSNVVDGWCSVAIVLQYGHLSKNGVWIEGVDYINPAMQTIFKKWAKDIWTEVNS